MQKECLGKRRHMWGFSKPREKWFSHKQIAGWECWACMRQMVHAIGNRIDHESSGKHSLPTLFRAAMNTDISISLLTVKLTLKPSFLPDPIPQRIMCRFPPWQRPFLYCKYRASALAHFFFNHRAEFEQTILLYLCYSQIEGNWTVFDIK